MTCDLRLSDFLGWAGASCFYYAGCQVFITFVSKHTEEMTTEQIKEQLSIHYLGALVAWTGHKIAFQHFYDVGVDVMITEVSTIYFNGRVRFSDVGNTLDVQVKCTTERSVTRDINKSKEHILRYDLRAKNFNDLILRRNLELDRRVKPLLFILGVLPEEKEKWLRLVVEEGDADKFLQMGGAAYWFYPTKELKFTSNKHRVRIEIPANNKVDLNFLSSIFENF